VLVGMAEEDVVVPVELWKAVLFKEFVAVVVALPTRRVLDAEADVVDALPKMLLADEFAPATELKIAVILP